jgi:hypothetical protein
VGICEEWLEEHEREKVWVVNCLTKVLDSKVKSVFSKRGGSIPILLQSISFAGRNV